MRIVGQDEELARIDALLDAGHGGLCFVGSPGMGRTTLAVEAERRARAHGYEPVGPSHLTADSTGWIIVVDDVHRLDPEALDALRVATARPDGLVVVTAPAGPAARSSAILGLWRDGALERRDLRPISRDAIGELCADLLGSPFDSAGLERVVELSGGNPRLVRELLVSAQESGSVEMAGGSASWIGPLQVSARLRDAVLADLGMRSEVSALAELMAVSGGLDLELATRLVGLDAAEEGEAQGLVRVEVDGRRRRLVFGQPIVAEVVRGCMGHLRLACRANELLDAASAAWRERDELERTMWLVCAGRETDVGAIVGAARAQRLAGALAVAEWLARTVAATNDPAAVLELSECLYWQGRFREEIELLVRHPLEDAPPALRALRGRQLTAAWFWGMAEPEVTFAIFDRELTAIEDVSARLSLLGHRSEARMFAGDFDAAIDDAEVVLEDPSVEVLGHLSAYTGLIPSLVLSGRVEDGLERAPGGLALMMDNPGMEFAGAGAFVGLCLGWFFAGEFDSVDALVGGLYGQSLAKPDDPLRGTWAVMLGRAALGRGDLALAISRLSEAAHLLEEHDPGRMLMWCLCLLTEAHAECDDRERAAVTLKHAERVCIDAIHCYDVELQLARAWFASVSGAPERARAIALAAADEACDAGAWGVAALALHEARRFGAHTVARWARINVHVQGPLFEVMASVANAGDDANRAVRVAEKFEALGASLWAAETYAGAARRFARSGDAPRLARAQERCLALVARCPGARTPALTDVEDLGRTAELSEREREVAQLAARGLTNRAIAEELVLSVRTVENHLARALRKLGLKSRRNLIGFFGG